MDLVFSVVFDLVTVLSMVHLDQQLDTMEVVTSPAQSTSEAATEQNNIQLCPLEDVTLTGCPTMTSGLIMVNTQPLLCPRLTEINLN